MTFDEEEIAFYYYLGRALGEWSYVEQELSTILLMCFGNKDKGLHQETYFAVENFRSRLQVVDSALANSFNGTTAFANWPQLYARTVAQSKARNRLAHRWPVIVPHGKPGRRYMLYRFFGKRMDKAPKRPQPYPGAIYVRDLAAHRMEFAALHLALMNFRLWLAEPQERQIKFREPAIRPPTMTQIRTQIFAKEKPRAKS